MNTTLSAECPEDATVSLGDIPVGPGSGPFEPGDVFTCSADGYNPTYTWNGIVNAAVIAPYSGSLYIIPEGDFQLICTATVDELTCTDSVEYSVEGSAFGKYHIRLNTVVRTLMLMTLL